MICDEEPILFSWAPVLRYYRLPVLSHPGSSGKLFFKLSIQPGLETRVLRLRGECFDRYTIELKLVESYRFIILEMDNKKVVVEWLKVTCFNVLSKQLNYPNSVAH